MTTVLIGRNILLLAGIRHCLAGTRFTVAKEVLNEEPDLSSLAEGAPVLVLICDSLTPDEYRTTITRLKAQSPSARVVILADHLSPREVLDLSREGLDGLCPTGMPRPAMLAAFEMVMLGELFLPASVSLALVEEAQSRRLFGSAPRSCNLSEREIQILRCLQQGASNKLIARHIGLAEATVKVHIKAILRKVRAQNRTQAAMWANEHLDNAVKHSS